MEQKGELRRKARSAVNAPVEIGWTDRQGNEQLVRATVVNISEDGIRVLLPEKLTPHTYVILRAGRLGLHGRASVRNCLKQGTKYVAGLEFSGGLKWKPQA
jgi:hypothetical protein